MIAARGLGDSPDLKNDLSECVDVLEFTWRNAVEFTGNDAVDPESWPVGWNPLGRCFLSDFFRNNGITGKTHDANNNGMRAEGPHQANWQSITQTNNPAC